MTRLLAQRDYYGKALKKLAEIDNVVVLDADLAGSTKTLEFYKVCPERFVEVGIAEQNMIGVASGLAAEGKVVFASTFGIFASGRCWEQIRLGIAYPMLNVKIVATHCGISVGEDGASHQALEDISLMRSLPNMTVISPADAYQTYSATLAIAEHEGPVYMRLGRSPVPIVTTEGEKFEIGKAKVLLEGNDITLFGTGQLVSSCLDAAEELKKEGIHAEVVNVSTIKPLDSKTILSSVSKTGCAVTAEEHSIIGGLGSAVSELLSEEMPTPLQRVGTKDLFGESGKPDELFIKYGLTAKDIVEAAHRSIKNKR
ncbi:MAG TPA: transketolase family protein [Candidatus Methanomethylophilaceae archaeon]|nr:transketolase family protein [Candidatus Methanomethylophilaceae archaeon]